MGASYYEGMNERILARVPAKCERVLEIGCAAGLLGAVIKERTGAEVWGIELNPSTAKEAKGRIDHVLVGDVEAMDPLPLPEGYFQCVICGDVLEHLRDPENLLRRLHKHLTPDATLIVNVPNIAHWSVIAGLLQGRFDYTDNGLLDRTHLRFFTPASLHAMLWESGYLVHEADGLHVELANAPPLQEMQQRIANAAQALAVDPQAAVQAASIYQQLYVARPVPDPYSDLAKMQTLLGPHAGALGEPSKRASIVIVTFNSEGTIDACLQSVLCTVTSEDEVIIVDNCSTDGTVSKLKGFGSEINMIESKENLGFSKGCNTAILQSKGAFVILLNPDTVVSSGWIEQLIAPFSDPRVGAIGPLSDNVCGDQFVGVYGGTAAGYRPTKLLIGFCMALRRDLLARFGLLEEACVLGADDLEMSWRLRTLGFDLLVSLATFVRHDCGASFASIGGEAKRRLVGQSDRALIDKLRSYYRTSALPSSSELWGDALFEEALGQLPSSCKLQ